MNQDEVDLMQSGPKVGFLKDNTIHSHLLVCVVGFFFQVNTDYTVPHASCCSLNAIYKTPSSTDFIRLSYQVMLGQLFSPLQSLA